MKHILGVSAGFHDAAVSVVREDGEILFAGHSERYSKVKNDPVIHKDLLWDARQWEWDEIAFYERPWMHNIQQFVSGQREYGPWTTQSALREHLGGYYRHIAKRSCYSHHLSHAAAGFQTSPFNEAAVVVIDAIGELDTISIYHAYYDPQGRAQYKRKWCRKYPHSIGLFYTAITKQIGLKPMEDEYITMGMAGWGNDTLTAWMEERYVHDEEEVLFKQNFHTGLEEGCPLGGVSKEDVAASAQTMTEHLIQSVMLRAKTLTNSSNLVYMGGVALNCVANSKLGQIFDRIWIMPNPGDAGSSLGAAALAFGRKLNWRDAFLGYDIPGSYPVSKLLDALWYDKIVGVASGRAEFGPRALGNRSLLADPRGHEIKDRVNEIKRRQKFRPFAPIILEERVHEYFEMPSNWKESRYMQIVAKVKRPDLFPAITHVDNTARVQTVPKHFANYGIRRLLEDWNLMTGCPMLLNTSLNIKGEPMVNDRADADRFQERYNVKVLS